MWDLAPGATDRNDNAPGRAEGGGGSETVNGQRRVRLEGGMVGFTRGGFNSALIFRRMRR